MWRAITVLVIVAIAGTTLAVGESSSIGPLVSWIQAHGGRVHADVSDTFVAPDLKRIAADDQHSELSADDWPFVALSHVSVGRRGLWAKRQIKVLFVLRCCQRARTRRSRL